MTVCPACAALAGDGNAALELDAGLMLHPVLGGGAVPGWLVVTPRRHVEQLDALTPGELAALGPTLARVGAALRASTPCEKLYVNVFAEQVPHLHVHLIARPPGLPAELRGPRLFLASERAPAAEVDAIFAAVRARLA